MISYPKTKIDDRWNRMSEDLRAVLFSPAYGETVYEIADDHHLSEEKGRILVRLVGYVILGFIHPEELDKKIKKEINGIDLKVTKEISDEIDRKIFSQFRAEILDMYSPISESVNRVESIQKKSKKESQIGNIKITNNEEEAVEKTTESETAEKKGNKEFIKSEFQKEESQKTEGKDKNTPFVIHQEEKREKEKPKQKKDFSFSFGDFFEKQEKNSPSAKVQTPKKDQKRTVHYSEYRTPASSDNDKSFINIADQKNKPRKQPDKSGNTQKQKEAASKPGKQNKKKDVGSKKKNNPSVSGNTIDLSNLN